MIRGLLANLLLMHRLDRSLLGDYYSSFLILKHRRACGNGTKNSMPLLFVYTTTAWALHSICWRMDPLSSVTRVTGRGMQRTAIRSLVISL
jgi:hypothetical protein